VYQFNEASIHTRYGLEYDLDVYNIVAVNDFNMGAMENKGLNVFNTALTLAKPSTATDADYERIESVVRVSEWWNTFEVIGALGLGLTS